MLQMVISAYGLITNDIIFIMLISIKLIKKIFWDNNTKISSIIIN